MGLLRWVFDADLLDLFGDVRDGGFEMASGFFVVVVVASGGEVEGEEEEDEDNCGAEAYAEDDP